MTEEELRHRIGNAVIVLGTDHAIKVGDLFFSNGINGSFIVSCDSNSRKSENITRQSAFIELNEVKQIFSDMLKASTELSEYTKNLKVEYHLNYNYGMGSLGICIEKDGEIEWGKDFKE